MEDVGEHAGLGHRDTGADRLRLTELDADNPATTSAKVEGDSVSFTINGSFPLDGTTRAVPTLLVDATVTATTGEDIVWRTPTSIVGSASVPILGSQSSTCSFPTSGAIGTTDVT